MGWRDHALRILSKGLLLDSGESPDPQILVRIFDEIEGEPELSERLDGLDESGVRAELVERYEIAFQDG